MYKYQWNQSNKKNINCFIYHLLCFVMILPTQHYLCTISKQLIELEKYRHFLIRGIESSFYKRHISRTSYHSKTELVMYQRKVIHLSTGLIQTLNQSCYQQSSWPLNLPRVHDLYPVCKIITILCFSYTCSVEK